MDRFKWLEVKSRPNPVVAGCSGRCRQLLIANFKINEKFRGEKM